MNETLKWYRGLSWLGILANLTFGVLAFAAPDTLISKLGLPYLEYNIWVQSVGVLIIALSRIIAFAVSDPAMRPRLNWLMIVVKGLIVLFWLYQISASEYPNSFYGLLAWDGVLLLVLFFLLQFGLPEAHRLNIADVIWVLKAPLRWVKTIYARPVLRYTVFPILLLLIVVIYQLWLNILKAHPEISYVKDEDQFKYGAIGLGMKARIPLYIFKVLPEIFKEKLPQNGLEGYRSLGVIYEDGKDMPIGFAQRHIGYKSVEPNCALCHTGSYVTEPEGPSNVILGGPAHELDLEQFQWFLYDCASDPRFNPDTLMQYIDKIVDMKFAERMIYKNVIIPFAKTSLQSQAVAYAWQKKKPLQGKGRTDTFNPTKFDIFHFPVDNTIGTVDLPQIWNQRPREGLYLHWDGNNNSLAERNYAAAMAVGATPESVIPANFNRVVNFLLDLPPAKYPYAINEELAADGKLIYEQNCMSCHSFGQPATGHVTLLEDVGTDPSRLYSFTNQLVDRFHQFNKAPFVFQAYRKTYGYANTPLDGVWARAPYLHNGSVANLEDLLSKPENRVKVFYKGYNEYSKDKVGFVTEGANAERIGFKMNTIDTGNGNQGHLYGTDLSEEDKAALIEYIKKL